jgi:hypothetical protein
MWCFVVLRMENKLSTSRLVVTGVSGFVGSHFSKVLEKNKITFRGYYNQKIIQADASSVFFQSDFLQENLEENPFVDADCVVHFAQAATTEKNLEMLKNVLSLCEKAKVKRFVLPSFLGVASGLDTPLVKEKYLAESLLLNSQISEKIIVRAPFLYGTGLEESRLLKALKKVSKLPFVYPLLHRKKRVVLLSVQSFCEQLLKVTDMKSSFQSKVLSVLGNAYFCEDILTFYHQRVLQKKKYPLMGRVAQALQIMQGGRDPWLEIFVASGAWEVERNLWNSSLLEAQPSSKAEELFVG